MPATGATSGSAESMLARTNVRRCCSAALSRCARLDLLLRYGAFELFESASSCPGRRSPVAFEFG